MASTQRRYGKEEFARRGDEVYETQVRPHLQPEDDGKFAAIDIESGAYELDTDELGACDKLNARIPDAQIAVVISNKADAPGIVTARERGLEALVIPSQGRQREEHEHPGLCEAEGRAHRSCARSRARRRRHSASGAGASALAPPKKRAADCA